MRSTESLLRKRKYLSGTRLSRQLSVVAWGRNTSGQVGQGLGVVHDEPAILSQLEGEVVTCIAAGRHHSAAVVQTSSGGTAWTWGCGGSGKLGHGDGQDQARPTRVEALVGHADIQGLALGHEHSLFLDSEGAVYSCGDNWQGQCGHGTPLQTIAAQQRAEFDRGRQGLGFSGGGGGGGASWAAFGSPQAQAWNTPQQEQRMAWAKHMEPHKLQNEREEIVSTVKRLLGREAEGFFSKLPSLDLIRNSIPARIGRDLPDPLASTSGEVEPVGSVAASKFFSAVSTVSGRVLTFGGGFSGELGGGGKTWETAASAVEGPVLQALERDGGAAQIAAGGTFCMALTHQGSVVLWGSLPGSPEARKRADEQPGVLVIRGVPRMTHIAAGYSHAVMSDGERVWAMGKWLEPSGEACYGGPWGSPEPVLEVSGIRTLSAGPHSTAVVSADGTLYLWGRLLSTADIRALRLKHGCRVSNGRPAEASAWQGLGNSKPTAVPGLGKVKTISLGLQHAIAVVE